MNDLTSLTPEEFSKWLDDQPHISFKPTRAEIHRRLERLEQCETALKQITHIPTMPFPDRQAHSERAFANAVWSAWCKIQDAARAALEEK